MVNLYRSNFRISFIVVVFKLETDGNKVVELLIIF